ncbi:hypothetical protein HO133_001154 [Letharia lupina]|uniref:Cyanate hydratase n=1 Tax=Letharia lupina TaxID=560253 RepID=A0A8H6CET3_9LECA|nr:uncharacterized protein HO133_001154 [Letharia lupina]KAF6222068.1 hypothetical protein HO133_001154 [Letharia lupina]
MASTLLKTTPRALPKLTPLHQRRLTSLVSLNIARMATSGTRVATLDSSLRDRLPVQAPTLFEAKAAKNLTFEDIAKQLGRNEVAVAAIFYGQAQTTSEDAEKLADILGVDKSKLGMQLAGYPFRGQVMDMPPREPLIYRLYEIVQNYGYAYKAILNEKFGDGIMSAISFSTKVEKETDKDGNNWAIITLRGKWLPFSRF